MLYENSARVEVVLRGSSMIDVYSVGGAGKGKWVFDEIEDKYGDRYSINCKDKNICDVLNWLHEQFGAMYTIFTSGPVYKPSGNIGEVESASIFDVVRYLARCYRGGVAFVQNGDIVAAFSTAQDALEFVESIRSDEEA